MYRTIALTLALGLSPALAEDLSGSAQLIEDFALVCEGPCPEAGQVALSSDEDGDGEAEYVSYSDEPLCDLGCEAQADASPVIDGDTSRHL